MGFQTPQLKLIDLLSKVRTGRLQLPDFQRSYKWDDERIRQLLVTVLRGHPMGVIMLLDTGGAHVRFKPEPVARVNDDLAVARSGDPAAVLDEPEVLLLDGQQRMTSLYQALTGSGVVGTKDARGLALSRRYFLDVKLALGDASDQDDAVRSIPENGIISGAFGRGVELDVSTQEKQVAAGLIPFTTLLGDGTFDWFMAYRDASLPGEDDVRKQIVTDFNHHVIKPITSYVLPAIQLDRSTTKEAVATVFEKVNTGGLPLNTFELLTATFAGDGSYYQVHGKDFRLREDWELTQEVLDRHPVLAGVVQIDFLQAVTLLATRARRLNDIGAGKTRPAAISARREDILRLDLSDYMRWAPEVRSALTWVAHFYTAQHIHTSTFLPYKTQTVPLTVFRVALGRKIDEYTVMERIRRWYWCGVLGEQYGSATESRFARDIDQIPSWALAPTTGIDEPIPHTVGDATFFESRLLSLRTKNSAAYKGIYALLMAKQVKDWRLDQLIGHASYLEQQIDIHHIFPTSWSNRVGIPTDSRESIINKTPLAKRTNIFLGGNSPTDYLARLEQATGMSSEQIDTILAGHLIDSDALRRADFNTFFRRRRAALTELVSAAMGSPVIEDIVEFEGELTGHEDSSAFEEEAEDLTEDVDLSDEHTVKGAH